MNYNELIKCFTELSPLLHDLMEVIQLIKAGDWSEVAFKSIELVSKGYPIVKECISSFTEPTNLTSKVNPQQTKYCCMPGMRGCIKWCYLQVTAKI